MFGGFENGTWTECAFLLALIILWEGEIKLLPPKRAQFDFLLQVDRCYSPEGSWAGNAQGLHPLFDGMTFGNTRSGYKIQIVNWVGWWENAWQHKVTLLIGRITEISVQLMLYFITAFGFIVHHCCLHGKNKKKMPQRQDVAENNVVAGHKMSGFALVSLLG